MNLHDWLQLILTLAVAFMACGNQWALEFYKSRKLKTKAAINGQIETFENEQKKAKSISRVADIVRIFCLIIATGETIHFMIQQTPLSNISIVLTAYNVGIIVLLIALFFIDRIQNQIIANGISLMKLIQLVALHVDTTKDNRIQTDKAIIEILDHLQPKEKSKL